MAGTAVSLPRLLSYHRINQEPGARSQEPGARSQEPGARSEEPGARSQQLAASSYSTAATATIATMARNHNRRLWTLSLISYCSHGSAVRSLA